MISSVNEKNLSSIGSNSTETENEIKIGNMFSMNLNKKLGSGAFGEIFQGYNIKTNEEVAIKLESNKSKTPQLNYESKVLKLLQGLSKIFTKYF
jgi:predicted Ser/Thr protein kinase